MYSLPVAELRAEAARIESETELDCQGQAREGEIKFIREQNELEVAKAKELSHIEVCTYTTNFKIFPPQFTLTR